MKNLKYPYKILATKVYLATSSESRGITQYPERAQLLRVLAEADNSVRFYQMVISSSFCPPLKCLPPPEAE